MPRRKSNTFKSPIEQITNQVRQLLGRVRQEIQSKEAALNALRRQESDVAVLVSGAGTNGGKPRPGNSRNGTGRTDWSSVLATLPKQFKASEVRKVRGFKDKRSSEIFAAITRWIEAGTVKRKERGLYERVK